MEEGMAAVLFALACNLDTALLAAGWRAAGAAISPGHSLVIAGVTTLITWLSLVLGRLTGVVLSPALADLLGGGTLAVMGLWLLLSGLRRREGGREPAPGERSPWGWVSLAAALAANNAGVGVAAGVVGLSPPVASGANFAVTLLTLALGRALAGRLPQRWAGPLSGAILLVLGLWKSIASLPVS